MSSFIKEAEIANEQRQKEEKEAKDAKFKLEGPVETLDEIVETVCKVVQERILREIKVGYKSEETVVTSNGLFKPKTITKLKYVYVSVNLHFIDSPYLAVRHIEHTNTNDDYEILSIRDSFTIRLTERDQLLILGDMLAQKLSSDNIKYEFSWIKIPDKKAEKKEMKAHKYPHDYIWAEKGLFCKYYLSEE